MWNVKRRQKMNKVKGYLEERDEKTVKKKVGPLFIIERTEKGKILP